MQFNNTTDSSGIVQDVNFWVKTDQTKYPLVDIARNASEWLKKAGLWIWQAAGDWEFDDKNLTTLPTATADLVDDQQDYSLPTTIFQLERVQVKDAGGNWIKLLPIDQADLPYTALEEFMKTKGLPAYYDVQGESLLLYPKPDASLVTIDDGLEVMIARDVDPFTSTDTTKEPGFSAYFHRIVSIGSALDYAIKQANPTKITQLKRLLYGDPTVPGDTGLKGELQTAYAVRHSRDLPPRIIPYRDDRI